MHGLVFWSMAITAPLFVLAVLWEWKAHLSARSAAKPEVGREGTPRVG